MRDPCLSIISAMLDAPQKPLKFYLATSKMSRGTFFKAKADLMSLGIVAFDGTKQLTLDTEKARDFVFDMYPGIAVNLTAPLGTE
jgi:hypothetical protein